MTKKYNNCFFKKAKRVFKVFKVCFNQITFFKALMHMNDYVKV